jgi:Flp pilus assembly protein TadG
VNQACQPKSSAAMARNLLLPIRRLAEDDRGAVLVYVTVILAALFGIGALVIDIGRLASTQTELQSFADHLALAVAGELDGRPDAITRANAVLARSEWQDTQTFADGGRALTSADATVRYLSGLPVDDTASVTPFVTTDSLQAAFAEVTVTPRTIQNWLTGAVNALTGGALPATSTAAATAVAGLDQYACDITPLMMCVPNASYSPVPGRMINLKSQNFWGPGAFGLLDVNGVNFDPNGPCGSPNQGANFFRCVVGARQAITRCFIRRNGVDIRPGQVTGSVAAGFNTRFDMYLNSLSSKQNDPDFAPAPNVVKGAGTSSGTGCVQNANGLDPYADSDPLPRDTCFGSGSTCSGSRFGNGTWDKAGYLAANHSGASIAGSTRYQVYLNEITAAGTGRILPTGKTESGRPVCSSSSPADPGRRVLVVAAIDCSTLPSGNASDVPVIKYVRVFLTEPVGEDSTNADIWVEEIDEVQPYAGGTGGGVAHDMTQLYR